MISFTAVLVKLVDVGPTAAGFYRNLFGGLSLLVLAMLFGQRLRVGRRLGLVMLAAGVFFALDLFFWHRSILYIGPGLSTILANFQVFGLAILGVVVFRERLTWRLGISIPLALAGLFLLVGPDWATLPSTYKTGVFYGLLTAAVYVGYLIALRHSQSRPDRLAPFPNIALISLTTAAIMGGMLWAEGGSLAIPNAKSWLILLTYGLVCHGLGWALISTAMPRLDASRVGLILLFQPTLTFIWDILFFHRPTPPLAAAGAVIALGAIYLGSTARVK
ncbi:MAG: DMT family transporter [Deltaproteobacteria bacterium]|nr:DMT family transporter [Deltaproteobacteria bacterium]